MKNFKTDGNITIDQIKENNLNRKLTAIRSHLTDVENDENTRLNSQNFSYLNPQKIIKG